MIGDVGLAVVLFASTNIDDLFVLLALFADRRVGTRGIVVGQYLGIAILFAFSDFEWPPEGVVVLLRTSRARLGE